jgi:L-fuconolactonase
MIIDAHCHVWKRWPYQPPVPDTESRARAEQLLFEMDQNGVEKAVLISAAIGDNPDSNDYVAQVAAAHPGRFIPFADIDSRWTPYYRRDGAATRLAEAAVRYGLVGFTYYLAEDDDGAWLGSEEGRRFLAEAESRRLIASLSVMPSQMPIVTAAAEAYPKLDILCHHMAFLGPRSAATRDAMRLVTEAARHPNIGVKISGFGNVASPDMDYPYPQLAPIVRTLHEHYGPWRMHWGSDWPVSRKCMIYKQTLDMVRRHCGLPDASVETILGPAMAGLLQAR